MPVDEHTTTIDDVPVFYRSSHGYATDTLTGGEAAAAGRRTPVPGTTTPVYLHGALTTSEDWTEFLERTGGIAPDLIGFGRSGKGGHLDYSPDGLTEFVERFLTELSIERCELIGHGWGGALALLLALRAPSRVSRLVLIDAVPLLPGFDWPRLVRLWRRPVLGELLMGATSKRQLWRRLRKGSVRPEAWTQGRLDVVWEQFDQGTQRALLRLHRAAAEDRLAELGAGLGELGIPTLVVWGERDPLIGPQFADAYGAALRQAGVVRIPDAGHWPWLDRPEVIDRVSGFVNRGQA